MAQGRVGRRGLVALLVAASAAAGACGSSSPSALAVVTAAPVKTTAAHSARTAVSTTVVGASGEQVTVDATGALDFDTHKGTMHLELQGRPVDDVIDGTTVYERIPGLEQEVGKPWVKIDLDTLGKAAGIENLGSLTQGQSNDPTAALDALRGASKDITTVGHESVRGTRTTHYHATADLELAASKSPPQRQATLRQLAKVLGVTTFPLDVWVDGAGRARRLRESMDFSKANFPNVPKSRVPKSMTLSYELYDFGVAVHATTPPPDQVADFATLLDKARAGA